MAIWGQKYSLGAVEWLHEPWLSAGICGLVKGSRSSQKSVTDGFNVLRSCRAIQNKLHMWSRWPWDWYLPDGCVPCS